MIPTLQEVKQGWNAFAKIYAQLLEKSNLQLGLSLGRMMQIEKAKHILEVGSGSGLVAVNLLQCLQTGVKYTSIDIADEMVKLSKERKHLMESACKFNNIDHQFHLGDGENLSFLQDESVDAYFASLCIHLTPDPNKALKEALRVLKKDGKIGFSVLGDYNNCSFFRLLDDTVKEFGIQTPQKRSMFRYGKREELIKLAQDNGVEVDFCWNETVTVGVFNEEDVEAMTRTPGNMKTLSQVEERIRQKIIDTMKQKFRERKEKFVPLQIENTLLVGRKPNA